MTVEKEEKPRKVFELKVDLWDDGEVTSTIIEIVPQDRGAPKKWLLERSDFIQSLKAQITTTPDLIRDTISEHFGFKAISAVASSSAKKQEVLEDAADDEEDDFDTE